MNKLITMVLIVLANSAIASEWNEERQVYMSSNSESYEKVDRIRKDLGGWIYGIRGVVGTGVIPCEENSGVSYLHIPHEERSKYDFLNCVLITTDSEEVAQTLKDQLPNEQKIDGVYVLPIFQDCMTVGDGCYIWE